MELYFILESDKEGNQFFCDKDLRRIYKLDYDDYYDGKKHHFKFFNCYLFTYDEIIVITKELDDEAILQNEYNYEETEIEAEKYNIFPITNDFWENDLQDLFFDYWCKKVTYDEDEDAGAAYEFYYDCYDDFIKSMNDKHNGSYFDDYLVRESLKRTRLYSEFIITFMDLSIEDYNKFWKENKNAYIH